MIFEGAKEEEEVTEDAERMETIGAPLVLEQRGSWERQGKHFLSRAESWAETQVAGSIEINL